MTDRVVKDPAHPNFPHGEARGYSRGCGCTRCRAAHSHAVKIRQVRKDLGHVVRVDAAPALRHLRDLVETHGCACADIAHVTGIRRTSIRKLFATPPERMHPDRARTLLAVTPEACRQAASMVPVGPYRDRLRRLQAHGYSMRDLSRRLGEAHTREPMVFRRRTHITRTYAKRIDALYESLSVTPGTSARSVKHAQALGYYPPACYDENDQYVPGSSPLDLNRRSPLGHEDHASRVLDTAHEILTHGTRIPAAAAKFDLHEKSFQRWRQTVGLSLEDNDGLTVPAPDTRWVAKIVREGINRWLDGAPSVETSDWIKAEVAAVRAERDSVAEAA